MKSLSFFYSPCPNDNYLFAFLDRSKTIEFNIARMDINSLNNSALKAQADIIKVSVNVWPLIKNNYDLLPCGGAFGIKTGPLLITKNTCNKPLNELVTALPGKDTTATKLFKALGGNMDTAIYCDFREVLTKVNLAEADAGIIIHETRFNLLDNIKIFQDLGLWWHDQYKLPLPLGVICIKKNLAHLKDGVCGAVLNSLKLARQNQNKAVNSALSHCTEKNIDIVTKHIDSFVNQYTLKMGEDGLKAIGIMDTFFKPLNLNN